MGRGTYDACTRLGDFRWRDMYGGRRVHWDLGSLMRPLVDRDLGLMKNI